MPLNDNITLGDTEQLDCQCWNCNNTISGKDIYCSSCGNDLNAAFPKLSLRLKDKVYIPKKISVLEFEICNMTDDIISKIHIQVECDYFAPHKIKKINKPVVCNDPVTIKYNFSPVQGIELLIRVFLVYWNQKNKPNVLVGEGTVYVRESPDGGNVVINDNRIYNIQEGYGIDFSEHKKITASAGIDSLEDYLPNDFQKGVFRDIALSWDLEATEGLLEKKQPLCESKPQIFSSVPTLHSAWLRFVSNESERKICYLHLDHELKLGKGKNQDISCLLTDEHGSMVPECNYISKKHLTLRVESNNCFIEDHSQNGTKINGSWIKHDTRRALDRQVISPAGLYPLEYREFKNVSSLEPKIRGLKSEILKASTIRRTRIQEPDKFPLNSIRLRKGGDDPSRIEYFIVMKDLDIGSAIGNPLVIGHHSVSELHAKIRRCHYGLEIEDLNSTNGTWINEERLGAYSPKVLENGDIIRLGEVSAEFELRESP
jgi:pSer/pThr/pTyr-binding forkhead associated (FHA) protein